MVCDQVFYKTRAAYSSVSSNSVLPTHLFCFQFPVSTVQCIRMGRTNPSIQSILAIKKYLTSVHCLLRAMYIQRRGKKDGGKKGSKWYGNILGRNWDIFFSQDSVSLMLLLLKGTAQSYPTIKPLMTPWGVLCLPHVMMPNDCSLPPRPIFP